VSAERVAPNPSPFQKGRAKRVPGRCRRPPRWSSAADPPGGGEHPTIATPKAFGGHTQKKNGIIFDIININNMK